MCYFSEKCDCRIAKYMQQIFYKNAVYSLCQRFDFFCYIFSEAKVTNKMQQVDTPMQNNTVSIPFNFQAAILLSGAYVSMGFLKCKLAKDSLN